MLFSRYSAVIVAAAALLAVARIAAAGQPPASWIRHYNGPSFLNDAGAQIALGPGGTVTIVGASDGLNGRDDIATVRYDAAGNELWVARYNGNLNWIDVPADIAVHESGATYVLGTTWGGSNHLGGGEWDYVIIKYNPDGSQAWVRQYDGPLHWSDTPTALAIDAAGNAYVSGFALKERDPFNRLVTHFHIAKFDASGTLAWEIFYDLNPHNGAGANDMRIAPDGNIVATGGIKTDNAQQDIVTMKVSPQGQVLWVRQWDSGGFNRGLDDGHRVRTDRLGNVYVLGSRFSDEGNRNFDATLLKYAPDGVFQWAAFMDFERADGFGELIDDDAGNLYLSGGWDNQLDVDGFVVSFTPSGQERWRHVFDGPTNYDFQEALGLMRGPDDLMYVGLDWQYPDAGGYDYTVAVMDNNGAVLDQWRYDTGSSSDTFYSLGGWAMDASGTIFIGAYSYFQLTLADFTTLKVPTQGGGLPGDVNGDGVVNVDDVEPFVRVLIGSPLSPAHVARCDLNQDGAADGLDLPLFVGLLLGA